MEAIHAHKPEAKKSRWQPPTHSRVRRHSSQSSCSGCGACRKIARSTSTNTNASASLMLKSLGPGKKVCATRFLQRTYGNRYVQRLIQTKLTIGRPGDKYEQEADRVADTVMRTPEPQVRRQPEEEEEEEIQMKSLSEQITPIVQRQPIEEEEEELQAKEDSGRTPTLGVTPDLETSLNASQGGGQPLPEADRSFMERRFGSDFSGVRVHTDSDAVQMSRELNAQAFTHGNNIYFGAGRYSPSTNPGQRLLAHELTHVVQQVEKKGSRRDNKIMRKKKSCTPAPGIPPSNCSAYRRNRWWLPSAYVNNATCACTGTPNSPTANCVRKFLQDRMAATPRWLKILAATAKRTMSGTAYYAFVQSTLTPRIYIDHVNAYRSCCCPSGPASYPAWIGVTSIPLPCSIVGWSIRQFGSCHGTPGRW